MYIWKVWSEANSAGLSQYQVGRVGNVNLCAVLLAVRRLSVYHRYWINGLESGNFRHRYNEVLDYFKLGVWDLVFEWYC